MEQTNKKENLLNRLDRLLDWIKSCDTKASIVIAVLGIAITFFTSTDTTKSIQEISEAIFKNMNFANLLFILLTLGGIFSFIFGIYSLIRVLTPRLRKDVEFEGIHATSNYYFETISKDNFIDFKESVLHETEEDEVNDILSQIYINAKIATIKYDYYRKGITFSSIGVCLLISLYFTGVLLLELEGFN